MKLLVILLALFATRPRPRPCPAPAPASPLVTVGGHLYGVVHLEGWLDENASNAGGRHLTFSIDGLPPDRYVHGGGHAWFGDGVTLPGMASVDAAAWTQRYYLADLTLGPDAIEPPCATTWCSYPQPTYYGHAQHLVPAPSLAAARARLAAIPRTGYPAGEVVRGS
jgi:hypothetical protein